MVDLTRHDGSGGHSLLFNGDSARFVGFVAP